MKKYVKKIILFCILASMSGKAYSFWGSKKDTKNINDIKKESIFFEKDDIALKKHDMTMSLGGRFREEFFYYERVRTLRNDFYDQNEFFKHRFDLNLSFQQGKKKYGDPAIEGFVELTNYVYWQNNSVYFPFHVEEIKSTDLDLSLAKDVKVKPLVPLIFLSEAWLKINIDVLSKRILNGGQTFLKFGFFEYSVGRGISLGYHDDLAIDYLGWEGEGGFDRFRSRPPGILFSSKLYKDLTFDLYYMKWRELNASDVNTMAPVYGHLLDPNRGPHRGRRKDSENIVVKFQYEPTSSVHVEPYYIYTRAPEQKIEFTGDASSYVSTAGCMVDWKYKNWNVNFEVAGQFGHQKVHAIDRNTKLLTRSAQSGGASAVFSHIVFEDKKTVSGVEIQYTPRMERVPVSTNNYTKPNSRTFVPTENLEFLVNSPNYRSLDEQGKQLEGLKTIRGTEANTTNIYNADFFGNQRFRNPYKLKYRGFMALLDISYELDKYPLIFAGAAGHISGDNYPYNEEKNRSYHGFVPLRSRYKGHAVRSTLIFDRLIIPRPLNISYRTLYAHNNIKDISNLKFLGLNCTWFPLTDKQKMSVTSDLMFFWEDAQLKKWDKDGKHSDPETEKYLALQRAKLGFPGVKREHSNPDKPDASNKGWLSKDDASKFLGTEFDIKMNYQVVDQCDFYVKGAVFFPGKLYKDLVGQPNEKTHRINSDGLIEYESLGHQAAFGFIVGFNYRF